MHYDLLHDPNGSSRGVRDLFVNPGGRGRSGFALRGASRSEVKGFDVVGAEPVVHGLQGGAGKLLGEEDCQTLLRP